MKNKYVNIYDNNGDIDTSVYPGLSHAIDGARESWSSYRVTIDCSHAFETKMIDLSADVEALDEQIKYETEHNNSLRRPS